MQNRDDKPTEDPTKSPKAPHRPGENMPPAGGESMEPADSDRASAKPEPGDSRRDR